MPRIGGLLLFAVLLQPFFIGAALAQRPDLPAMCEMAATQVARESGVPVSVLKAISLTETGRKSGGAFRPWPWTVNMEGEGHWFSTRDEAQAYVFKEFKRGARSFDVGCFQINYRWHGEAFTSIEQMFDPMANARYAAKYLTELFQETGSWTQAAGTYHSRTKKFADRYAARFAALRRKFATEDDPNAAPLRVAQQPSQNSDRALGDIPEIPDIVAAQNEKPTRPRENNFPLLIRQEGRAPGLGGAAGASLFASALEKRGAM